MSATNYLIKMYEKNASMTNLLTALFVSRVAGVVLGGGALLP